MNTTQQGNTMNTTYSSNEDYSSSNEDYSSSDEDYSSSDEDGYSSTEELLNNYHSYYDNKEEEPVFNSDIERLEYKKNKLISQIDWETQYVELKPYSHNIISLCLRQLNDLVGTEETNKILINCGLTYLGWSPMIDTKQDS